MNALFEVFSPARYAGHNEKADVRLWKAVLVGCDYEDLAKNWEESTWYPFKMSQGPNVMRAVHKISVLWSLGICSMADLHILSDADGLMVCEYA